MITTNEKKFITNIDYPIGAKIYGKCIKDSGAIKSLESVSISNPMVEVDLGTLTWAVQSGGTANERAVSTSLSSTLPNYGTSDYANFICAKYEVDSAGKTWGHSRDKTISSNGGTIQLYDSELIGKTAQEIKSALSGVKLLYESTNTPYSQTLSLPLYGVPDESTKVVFNQLVPNGNFENSFANWENPVYSKTKSIKNNILTLERTDRTTTGNVVMLRTVVDGVSIVANHKYFLTTTLKASASCTVAFTIGGGYGQKYNLTADTWTTASTIITTRNDDTRYQFYFDSGTDIPQGGTLQVKNCQMVDLTLMYGAGNEPTTLSQIPDIIKNQYHEYSTGYVDYLSWKVRDEWENCKQTKRVRVVDLGTLNWNYNANYGFITTGLNGLIKTTEQSTTALGNLLCSKYETGNYTIITGGSTDKKIGVGYGEYGYVVISDSDYTDKTAFKESLSGVLLFYETNEPIITHTSTCLVAKKGINTITIKDNNSNELGGDFLISYNKLLMKHNGKYIKNLGNIKTLKDNQNRLIFQRPMLPSGFSELFDSPHTIANRLPSERDYDSAIGQFNLLTGSFEESQEIDL